MHYQIVTTDRTQITGVVNKKGLERVSDLFTMDDSPFIFVYRAIAKGKENKSFAVNSDLDNLLRAIEEGCAEKVAAAAHSIRGASGNFGLANLHETAKQIEEKGRQGILEGVVETAHLLTEELKRLEEAVDNKP